MSGKSQENVREFYSALCVGTLFFFFYNWSKVESEYKLIFWQEFGCSGSQQMPLVMKLIHYLYDADILSEEVIIQWYQREPANKENSQGHKDIRKQVHQNLLIALFWGPSQNLC